MSKIKGPAVFLAQFLRDQPPYNNLKSIGKWFAGLGYKGVQIPGWDGRVIDIDRAAKSKAYCDDLKGTLKGLGLEVTEVAGYLAGQVLAIHPAYEAGFEGFHPKGLRSNARTEWAAGELKKCILASANFGLRNIPVLSGGFAWHMMYPWPQRPVGLIDEAFKELAKRWRPLLDLARDKGCVFGYELHPGSDIYDGATFEMFLEHTKNHPAACINLIRTRGKATKLRPRMSSSARSSSCRRRNLRRNSKRCNSPCDESNESLSLPARVKESDAASRSASPPPVGT